MCFGSFGDVVCKNLTVRKYLRGGCCSDQGQNTRSARVVDVTVEDGVRRYLGFGRRYLREGNGGWKAKKGKIRGHSQPRDTQCGKQLTCAEKEASCPNIPDCLRSASKQISKCHT